MKFTLLSRSCSRYLMSDESDPWGTHLLALEIIL